MSQHQTFTVEVAPDLTEPLEHMSAATGQPASSLIDRALREYLDRNWRPPASDPARQQAEGGTSSYIELTAREELLNLI